MGGTDVSQAPIWRRYLRLFGPDVAADVDDELRFHLEMRTEELIAGGWSPESARQEAVRLFGDVREISSECRRLGKRRLRAKRRSSLAGEIRRDAGFAVRMAMKRPAHSVVIVASLALGIGVNIAIFNVAKRVLVDQLPVENPEELVLFEWFAEDWQGFSLNGTIRDTETGGISSTSFSYSIYRRISEHQNVLSSVFAFAPVSRINIGVGGRAVLGEGQLVSGTYFPGLRVTPAIGRLIGPADDGAASEPVVVLSHGLWSRQFGLDPSVIGRSINLNGRPFTVVGVAPKDFHGTLQVGTSPAVHLPLAHVQTVFQRKRVLESADHWFLRVMGRLEPGVDIDAAHAMLAPLLMRTVEEDLDLEPNPDGSASDPRPRLKLLSGAQALDERRAEIVGPMAAAVGVTVLVLLIACANAATLLLAGTVARRREIAIRLSLGAGRARIIRQLLTETLVLAAVGGLLGFVFSHWVSRGLVILMSSVVGSQMVLDLSPDLGVLGIAALVSVLTGVVFGIVPALRMLSVQPAQNLQDGGDREGHSGSSFRLGKVLVAGQVALSLVLLVMAGLFVRTVGRLVSVDTGFTADGVLMFRVDPTLNGYDGEGLARLCDGIKDAVGALPGAEETTFSTFSLVSGSGAWDRLSVSEEKKVGTFVGAVDPGFLKTMHIRLLEGRDLHPDDRADTHLVAIVNQTFSRRAFGSESAVGREFSSGKDEDRRVVRIVGVFRDGNSVSLHAEPEATAYIPYRQAADLAGLGSATFYVRTAGPAPRFAESVRNAVSAVDRDLPIFEMKPLSEQVSDAMAQERSFLALSGVSAAFALVLSCIGVFGTVSYALSRRIREIGIRMTLGASKRGILRSAYRELDMVVVGVVVGLGVALLAARGIESFLFGIDYFDPLALAMAAVVMLGVGVLAVSFPARRATRVDPVEVLRAE
jgi:predicted permease